MIRFFISVYQIIKNKSIKDTEENIAANPISKDLITVGKKVYITKLEQNGIITSISKLNKEGSILLMELDSVKAAAPATPSL